MEFIVVSGDGAKGAQGARGYHALRILLLVLACACVIAAALALSLPSDKQARVESVASEVAGSQAQANVLLLMSYSDADPVTPMERAGVVDVMNRASVAVDIEYIDAIRYPKGSMGYEAWESAMAERLPVANSGDASVVYDAVICAGDEALSYVEDNRTGLFRGVPVVFFGVNDFRHARQAVLDGNTAGMLEQAYFGNTIELAKSLFPNTAKIVAVVDDTPSGIGDRAQFEAAVANLGGMDVEYLDASTMARQALESRLREAGDDSIVFFLDAFNDSSKNTYQRDESARFVSSATSRPVFGVATGVVGQGVIGAGFTDPEGDGKRAAEMCVDILNGANPANIELVTDGTEAFAFDEQVMGRFGVSASALPQNAAIVGQGQSSAGVARTLTLPVALIVLAAAFIAAFAVLGYRKSAQTARANIARENDRQRQFYYDAVTGKPNMNWLNEFKDDAGKADAIGSLVGVGVGNLDEIVDLYGPVAGDSVMEELVDRLEAIDAQFVVRSSDSNFLVGLDGVIDAEADGNDSVGAEGNVLGAMGESLSQPFTIAGEDVVVDVHVGVATRSSGLAFDDMVTGVDCAIRESRRNGMGRKSVYYDTKMKQQMEDRFEIIRLLKQSIKKESFVVMYQPQIDARSGDVSGYEALVRLKGNAYNPSQFIPVAEMTGLIIDVDRIVTKKVVHQLATWKKRHKRLAPISINYSKVQLQDKEYVDYLIGLLNDQGVSPSLVRIEVTENVLSGYSGEAEAFLSRLAEEGISVALDDFGAGFAALPQAMNASAQAVKIDKSVVDAYMQPGKDEPLSSLVQLARNLGKTVVVEGVETPEQLQVCRDLGCDIVQGYYYSQPLLPEKAAQFKPSAS